MIDKFGKKFDIRFHNRNTVHFTNTGTQLFPCFQHWHSFSPCKQKLAVVISTFYRISRSCNSWTNIVDAVSKMKYELLSLKYPLRVLLRAAGRMATTDARWASIEDAWRADSRRQTEYENEVLVMGPGLSACPFSPTTASRVHTHCAKSPTSA